MQEQVGWVTDQLLNGFWRKVGGVPGLVQDIIAEECPVRSGIANH
jgi:hypothetical protein